MKNRLLERTELGVSTSAFLKAGESGIVPLPERVEDALAALDRATEAIQTHESVDLEAARQRFAEQTAEALRKDAPLPSAKAVEQVAVMARSHEEVRRALTAAELQLFTELRASIPTADQIVVDIVQPALLTAYDEARALLTDHPLVAESGDVAIGGGPGVAAAWQRFGELVERIGALRILHAKLTDPAVPVDLKGTFSEWQEAPNDQRLWGARGAVNIAAPWRPWPSEPRARLAWVLASGLSIWIPTASERDQRHAEAYADAPRPRPSNAVMIGVGG